MFHIKPIHVFLSLLFWMNSSLFAEGRTFNEMSIRHRMSFPPSKDDILLPFNFGFRVNQVNPEHLKAKSKRLLEIANRKLKISPSIDRKDMDKLVGFIELSRSRFEKELALKPSLYIHHADRDLPISIALYDSGRIYLIFQDEKGQKQGGFKTFSRSIEYQSERPHAHLEIYGEKLSDLENALDELKKQDLFQNSKHLLSFLDADLFTRKDSDGQPQHAIAIEEELFDGDLGDLIEKKVMKPRKALGVFIQMTEALIELHEKDHVHRDIKPENFLFKNEKGQLKVKLADFGLTQSKEDDSFDHICGTPGYIDPNECKRCYETGTCLSYRDHVEADIFSLGIAFMDFLHGPTHRLRIATRAVNKAVFKKDRNELTIKNAVDMYEQLHKVLFTEQNVREDGQLIHSLHALIGRMIHPDPQQRISRQALLLQLGGLKASEKGKPFFKIF